jgi:hypothetical protein
MPIDVGALVVVAEQHCAFAELGTGGFDADLCRFIGEGIECIEMNGCSLHERLKIQPKMNGRV